MPTRRSAMPEGSTRMTLRNRGTPAGFPKLVAPFPGADCALDLATLKTVLEANRPG